MSYEPRSVASVLYELALSTIEHKDGRSLTEADKARLAALADVADRLNLSEPAERLRHLLAIAERGYTSDLIHAALKVFAS